MKTTPSISGTFILGLGAQKSATSWVHRYLLGYPEADMGVLKEYHVWDTLKVDHFSKLSPLSFNARMRSLAKYVLGRNIRGDRLRRRFCRNPSTYYDYFSALLDPGHIRLTGDITPSYSALRSDVLQEIRDTFLSRGIAVKAIFLMRDPVERCHSVVRMHKRDGKSREGVDITLPDDQALYLYAQSPDAHLRTDYHLTLEAIDSVFPPEDVFLGFYETLFSEKEVLRLSEFLGVSPNFDFVNRKVNVSARSSHLTLETSEFVRREFSDVYEACAERFPITRSIWNWELR